MYLNISQTTQFRLTSNEVTDLGQASRLLLRIRPCFICDSLRDVLLFSNICNKYTTKIPPDVTVKTE